MDNATNVPVVPAPLALLLRPLPLWPLRLVLQRAAESVRRQQPALFARLEGHAEKIFLVDPVDLPFVFRLRPHPDRPMVEPRRREDAGAWDARIAGPLAALLGMLHGAYDGDALFFSRDIVFEGDTEAVLALRNALDDADIDLPTEIAAALAPTGAVEQLARRIIPSVIRIAGLTPQANR
jgi:predicted lipid carrier protein YhbT